MESLLLGSFPKPFSHFWCWLSNSFPHKNCFFLTCLKVDVAGESTIAKWVILQSFWLGWVVGSWPLFWALFVSFVLGTAYSINLPLLRWKRFAFVAALCILAVQATHVFGRPSIFSRPLIFATAFMSFFSVVIALFKDIPDFEGDTIFGIRSFTVGLGQEQVVWICMSMLEIAYGVAILVGVASSYTRSKWIMVLGHAILASVLWNRVKSVDLKYKSAITSCYMFIWKPRVEFKNVASFHPPLEPRVEFKQ